MRLGPSGFLLLVDAAGNFVSAVANAVVPCVFARRRELHHRDAAVDGAHQLAKVASYTFGLIDPRDAGAGELTDGVGGWSLGDARIVGLRRARAVALAGEDALVRAVLAGRHAELAADALVLVDAGDELVVEV